MTSRDEIRQRVHNTLLSDAMGRSMFVTYSTDDVCRALESAGLLRRPDLERTPEEQAVIDAAQTWLRGEGGGRLEAALHALLASRKPKERWRAVPSAFGTWILSNADHRGGFTKEQAQAVAKTLNEIEPKP